MKKILTIAFVLAFLVGLFPASVAFAGQQVDYPLLAGQTTQVGMIHVFDDGVNLTVQYEITEPGWFLVETHLYVGTAAPTNGAPGQFMYQHTAWQDTNDTYVVPNITVGTKYYIAAHAIVANEENIVGWDCPMTLDDINAAFPDSGSATFTYNYPYVSPKGVSVSTDGILNGTYPSWCIDYSHPLWVEIPYSANFYSSYEPDTFADLTTGDNPYIDKPENLDLVNWVINQNFPVNDTKNAIWQLIDATPPPCDAACPAIVDEAFNYEGFVPDLAAGEVVAIIISPFTGDTILQAAILELGTECTPIYQEETAWASAGGDAIAFKTGWGSYFTYTP